MVLLIIWSLNMRYLTIIPAGGNRFQVVVNLGGRLARNASTPSR